MKRCSKCGEVKPCTEFYKRKDSRDGLEGRCKLCANKDKKSTPEKNRERSRKYYHSHKELCNRKTRDWKDRNREKYLSNLREYRRGHPQEYNPEKGRIATIRSHGISPSYFENLRTAQSNECAICHKKEKLVIDHDHKTGKVRGLLCRNCNLAIGYLEDDPILSICVSKYLMDTQSRGIPYSELSIYSEYCNALEVLHA